MQSAFPITPDRPVLAGAGLVDVGAALAMPAPAFATQRWIRAIGAGPGGASSWAGASWTGASWTGASWTGASWTGASWTGASLTTATWASASWS
jgi:serine protease AprX